MTNVTESLNGCKRYFITCTFGMKNNNRPGEYITQVKKANELFEFFTKTFPHEFEDINLLSRSEDYTAWDVKILTNQDINVIVKAAQERFKEEWIFESMYYTL